MDRLFQLVDPIVGEKDLGHVGFATYYLACRRPIGISAL